MHSSLQFHVFVVYPPNLIPLSVFIIVIVGEWSSHFKWNDLLKSDPSEDYTSFLQEYQRKREQFDSRREIPSIVAKDVEGVL